ncbi:MAG: hypothetical protein QG671_83 [Actinomycetota bacterium]|nr:hypothetical protein [Actinomycetota bacterium]
MALSRGSPRVGVTHHLRPLESGLSSTGESRPRPPGRLVCTDDTRVTQFTATCSPHWASCEQDERVGEGPTNRTNPPPFLAMEGDSSSDQYLGVSSSATDATYEFGPASGLFGYQLRYSRSLVDSLVRRIALFRPPECARVGSTRQGQIGRPSQFGTSGRPCCHPNGRSTQPIQAGTPVGPNSDIAPASWADTDPLNFGQWQPQHLRNHQPDRAGMTDQQPGPQR